MWLLSSAHSANAFLGIEVNANVADLSDKVQAVHESDRRRFQLPFRYLHTGHLLCAFFERRRLCASGFLKEADPLFKVVCNVRGRLLFGDAFRLNIDQGLPETRSPDGKPDEPGNVRRSLQPANDPVSLCTTSDVRSD